MDYKFYCPLALQGDDNLNDKKEQTKSAKDFS